MKGSRSAGVRQAVAQRYVACPERTSPEQRRNLEEGEKKGYEICPTSGKLVESKQFRNAVG